MTLDEHLDAWMRRAYEKSTGMLNLDSAFRAGAAAMAEILSAGQALKIESAPHRYLLRFRRLEYPAPKADAIHSSLLPLPVPVGDIISRNETAYTRFEAIEQLRQQIAEEMLADIQVLSCEPSP